MKTPTPSDADLRMIWKATNMREQFNRQAIGPGIMDLLRHAATDPDLIWEQVVNAAWLAILAERARVERIEAAAKKASWEMFQRAKANDIREASMIANLPKTWGQLRPIKATKRPPLARKRPAKRRLAQKGSLVPRKARTP